jgi:hypothetical protein
MSEFSICEGVNWEVSNGQSGVARFSEGALDDPRHDFLYNVVRSACVDDLVDSLGETIGSGKFGEVRTVTDAPHLVAKLHSEPFANTALNVCLEAGLARVEGDLDLFTPKYIGYVQAFGPFGHPAGYTALTLMSRIEGANLSAFIGPGEDKDFKESAERKEMVRISSEAVGSVGVNPNTAYWADIHKDNLIVAGTPQTLEEAYRSPIAVIDIPTRAWADSIIVSK